MKTAHPTKRLHDSGLCVIKVFSMCEVPQQPSNSFHIPHVGTEQSPPPTPASADPQSPLHPPLLFPLSSRDPERPNLRSDLQCTASYSTLHHSTLHHSTLHHSTLYHSTLHHSTLHHSQTSHTAASIQQLICGMSSFPLYMHCFRNGSRINACTGLTLQQ